MDAENRSSAGIAGRWLPVALWVFLFAIAAPLAAQTVHRRALADGLTLVAKDHQLTHATEIQVLVRAGPVYENGLLGTGVSELLQRLLLEQARGSGASVLHLGEQLRAEVHEGTTRYALTVTDAQLEQGLQLLAQTLAWSGYNEEDLDRHRRALRDDLATANADPAWVERQALTNTVLRRHPARLPIFGRSDQVAGVQLAQVRGYQAARYTAPNITVVVVGHLDPQRLEDLVETAFAGLSTSGWSVPEPPREPPQYAPRTSIRNGPVRGERHAYAWRIPPAAHPDHAALAVLAALLGHPRHSPLLQALTPAQLARDLRVFHRPGRGRPGYLGLSYTPYPERGADAWQSVQAVIAGLAKGGPGTESLHAAKLQLRREDTAQRGTVSGIADDLARWEQIVGVPDYGRRMQKAIAAVTGDDIKRVAAAWLHDTGRSKVVLQETPAPDEGDNAGNAGATLLSDVPPRIERIDGEVRILHHYLPVGLAHLRISIGGGRGAVGEGERGAIGILMGCFAAGSRSLQGQALQERLAAAGMDLRVAGGLHAIDLILTCFPEDVDQGLAILVDILKQPAIDADRVRHLRQEAVAALADNDQNGDWRQRLHRRLRQILLGDHYASVDPHGQRDELEAMGSEAIAALHRRLVVTGNVVVACYGEYDAARASDRLRALLAAEPALPDGEVVRPVGAPWPTETLEPSVADLRWRHDQSALALGWRFVALRERRSHDAAVEVLCALLAGGDGGGGRVARAVAGRARTVQLVTESYAGRGLLQILLQADPDRLDAVQEAVRLAMTDLLVDLSAPADDTAAALAVELATARELCITRRILEREDVSSAAAAHVRALLLDGDLDDDARYAARITAVKREDLAALAHRYLDSEPVVVRLSPAAEELPPPVAPPAERAP